MVNAIAEGMASCAFRGVPTHVPMFTFMGRPRAGAFAFWAALCRHGAGLRCGLVFSQIAR